MISKMEIQQGARFDWLKWLIIIVLFMSGLAANYYYVAQPWPIRLLGWLILMSVILVTASQTQQGKRVLNFARESRLELRKVYWPTKQETIQTTFIVAAMVVILALILWCIDGVLMWLISWLMGQRG